MVVNAAQRYARGVVVWSGPVVCVFSLSRSVTHIRVPDLSYNNPRVMREADAAEQGRRTPMFMREADAAEQGRRTPMFTREADAAEQGREPQYREGSRCW